MPRTLDEALRIALRLEAWVKTTKMSVREQERTDRVKQKVRASGQQESVDKKPTSDSDSGSRICKIESDLTKMSTNMYKQCEELKRLISQKQRTTQELSNHSKGANKPSVIIPHQSEKTVTPRSEKPTSPTTASQPVGNTYSNIRQGPPSYPISCWYCGVVGHLSRNCPMRVQGTTYSPPSDNFASRSSKQQTKRMYTSD